MSKTLLSITISMAFSMPTFAGPDWPEQKPEKITPVLVKDKSKAIKTPDILNPNHQDTVVTKQTFDRKGPTIQVALILDTSGSMNGLLENARTHIWRIVNELALANKGNESVSIQVSLMEYGKSTLPAYTGYIQTLSPLTYDLDSVSEALFSTYTDGGDEFAGQAIGKAVHDLQWSEHPDDLKVIIVAGNENFDQGNVSFIETIREAKSQNIIVNTVFCGPLAEGKSLNWEYGAILGGGKYMNVDQNRNIQTIVTPYDQKIAALGSELNNTFIASNSKGANYKTRSLSMDVVAESMSDSFMTDRALSKIQSNEATKEFDLVEIAKDDMDKAIETSKQIAEYKDMDEKAVRQDIQDKIAKKEAITKELIYLRKQRQEYLDSNKPKEVSFGDVLSDAVTGQAKQSGFEFK